jgi:hypothetical protein
MGEKLSGYVVGSAVLVDVIGLSMFFVLSPQNDTKEKLLVTGMNVAPAHISLENLQPDESKGTQAGQLKGMAGNWAIVWRGDGYHRVHFISGREEKIDMDSKNGESVYFYYGNGLIARLSATYKPDTLRVESLDPQQPFSWSIELADYWETMVISPGGMVLVDKGELGYVGKMGEGRWPLPSGVILYALSPDSKTMVVLNQSGGDQVWEFGDELPKTFNEIEQTSLLLPEHEGMRLENIFFVDNDHVVVNLTDGGNKKSYLQIINVKTHEPVDEMLTLEGISVKQAIAWNGNAIAISTLHKGSTLSSDIYHIAINPDQTWGDVTQMTRGYYVDELGVIDLSGAEPSTTFKVGLALYQLLVAGLLYGRWPKSKE